MPIMVPALPLLETAFPQKPHFRLEIECKFGKRRTAGEIIPYVDHLAEGRDVASLSGPLRLVAMSSRDAGTCLQQIARLLG